MTKSRLEEAFAFQVKAAKLPKPEREFRFAPERKFRADFAWPKDQLLLEVEGAVWTNGRHTRGSGFTADCEKYALAAILGYRVIRVTGEQVDSGEALEWVERALGRKAA